MDRRSFLQSAACAAFVASGKSMQLAEAAADKLQPLDAIPQQDSLYHGDAWESLNPGFWQVEGGALRRRLHNYGDRARRTGFPFHYETHQQRAMPMEYDPSLPHGALYHRSWYLQGNFTIALEVVIGDRTLQRREGDAEQWRMYQPGNGFMGISFGAKTQFDSFGVSNRAWRLVWTDDNRLHLQPPRPRRGKTKLAGSSTATPQLKPGDRVGVLLTVSGDNANTAKVTGTLTLEDGKTVTTDLTGVPRKMIEGWFGPVGRGGLDFSVTKILLDPAGTQPRQTPQNDCLNCYALGTTLRQVGDEWRVKFVGMFRSDGKECELRISDSASPQGGWKNVPVAGKAKIVSNDFRRNTTVVDATLPKNPVDATLYYTVWKDGQDVTADVRVGTDSTGPGTGLVGDVPATGNYVGRLPQLKAPYRLAGLSCHAINSRVVDPTDKGRPTGTDGSFDVRDQPTYEAYRHLDDYNFQVMVWEDDVWYMELLIYPPSPDDAWKIVNTTISGPTTRWQMMRHWNVINPGDHDYGMDDVKGPEQIVIRLKDGLGQDRDYMRRNFQIVHHLITGAEEVDPLANPKKWRQWKMPNRDFSLVVVDSRLWRTSQDTKMWDDEGWGHMATLYDRADPTRTLLGEEQFAWLQEVIRSDSSPLICLTGLNGLHTVWTGGKNYSKTDEEFAQRDRVAADYAGWVAAGSDRVLDLLGSRDGVVTVYGDVHNGCIMKNKDQRLFECSFGPIGRTGGRAVIEGFGPEMRDFDGRPLTVHALYHRQHGSPDLKPVQGPTYWNFLEMTFDPSAADPQIELRIRNLIDPPTAAPRGGGSATDVASNTGRPAGSVVPDVKLLADADVHITLLNGHSCRGTRTDANGKLVQRSLVDVAPGTQVLMAAHRGEEADAKIVTTMAANS